MPDPTTALSFLGDVLKIVGGGLVAVIGWAIKDAKEKGEYVKRDTLLALMEGHRKDIENLLSDNREELKAIWSNCKAEFSTKEHVDGGLRLTAMQLKEHSKSIARLDGHILQLITRVGLRPQYVPPPPGSLDTDEQES